MYCDEDLILKIKKNYKNKCLKNICEIIESNMFYFVFFDCLCFVLVIFILFLGLCVVDFFKEWENLVFFRLEMVMIDES